MLKRGLIILAAIVSVVLLYLLTRWVFQLIGLNVPEDILRVAFVLIAIVAAIGAISGKYDNYWGG